MKRPLNSDEKKISELSLKSKEKETIDLKENLSFQELAKEFYISKCAYEDKIKPYNRKIEMDNFNSNINMIKEKIAQNEAIIKDLNLQIKKGITVKEVKGI